VPDAIEITMVDASVLSDYEVWFTAASVLWSAVVGIAVAFAQAVETKASNASQLGWTAIVFGALLVLAGGTAWHKRRLLRKKGRIVRLRATSEVAEQKA
jgi:hypothetical protein